MSSDAHDLTKLSFEELLDRIAARTPAPGGGSVAAAAGALAVALARMVVAYSASAKSDPASSARIEDAAIRLHRIDELVRALITEDALAYAELAASGKARRSNAVTPEEYGAAVLKALAVPMQLAALAADALRTLESIRELANPRLSSDFDAAVILAHAAARIARCMVRVNLPELHDLGQRARLAAQIDQIVGREPGGADASLFRAP